MELLTHDEFIGGFISNNHNFTWAMPGLAGSGTTTGLGTLVAVWKI